MPRSAVYEDERNPRFELPVGMSMRNVMGVDRVYFNCALCHTGTVRETAGAAPQIVPGMPSNRFELGTLLGFRMDTAPESELTGNTDFPSVWNQKPRKGMWLHWDGNNCSLDERNLSAGFGTGATPSTIDRDKVLRVADWLWDKAKPPPFPQQRINAALAADGKAVFTRYCWRCHGERDAPFRTLGDGSLVGTVTDIDEIGTDRRRLDSYTAGLASAQNTLYAGFPLAGDEACQEYIDNVCNADQDEARYRELRAQCYPSRFSHFRKTNGYASMPLDGLWLRAPYLHNGSVPNLRQMLLPEEQRTAAFYIGYDVYDFDNVGFVTNGDAAA